MSIRLQLPRPETVQFLLLHCHFINFFTQLFGILWYIVCYSIFAVPLNDSFLHQSIVCVCPALLIGIAAWHLYTIKLCQCSGRCKKGESYFHTNKRVYTLQPVKWPLLIGKCYLILGITSSSPLRATRILFRAFSSGMAVVNEINSPATSTW